MQRMPWEIASVPPPWGERPSIHAHLVTHQRIDGLTPGGHVLPDEPSGPIKWGPGTQDGLFSHHSSSRVDAKHLAHVQTTLQRFLDDDSQAAPFYTAVVSGRTLGLADALGEALAAQACAADREAVKLGIACLGWAGVASAHRESLLILGRSDEFALFVAVAMDHEDDLLELAKVVHGWGRIHVVERLARSERPDVKGWLLREGFRNGAMYEYLAFICATAGDLAGALQAAQIDEALLAGAGDLISSLLTECGPVEDIDEYADAVGVIERYLGHLGDAPRGPGARRAVERIQAYVTGRGKKRFKAAQRREVMARCEKILKQPA
jgi:hypothetical protein